MFLTVPTGPCTFWHHKTRQNVVSIRRLPTADARAARHGATGAGAMKEQFVGDIHDFRKYALLRALAASGKNRIGVCWMLTPDSGTDGGKLAYIGQRERYRPFDPELFDLINAASKQLGWRNVATIENMHTIPGAAYFGEDLLPGIDPRRAYMQRASATLSSCDLVFFDPDNGIAVKSVTKARSAAVKFIFPDEIADTYDAGKSVLIYQHFPFIEREAFIAACRERLASVAPDATIWAFRTAHVVFLLLLHPKSPASLAAAAEIAATRWQPKFITGGRLRPSTPNGPLRALLAELETADLPDLSTEVCR